MTTPPPPTPKATKAEITAPKGGDQTVAPIKGKIAAAIKATGKTLNAISREHGLNPSQMRRLSLDQVGKVDVVRAEVIAKALGVKLADLFGAPEDKATQGHRAPRPARPGHRQGHPGRPRSRAAKAGRVSPAPGPARPEGRALLVCRPRPGG